MDTYGECSVRIGDRRRVLRGSATFGGLGGLETAVEPNMDGSVYQTAKTTPVTLKFSLENQEDAQFTKAELTASHDVVFVEEHRGKTHYLSNAKIAGSVSYDPATGELSDFTFACSQADYRSV